MATPSTSRARLLLLALVTTAVLGAGVASSASGTQVWYCSGQYTPAHGWCYNGAPFHWTYMESDYYGGGDLSICAAVNNYFTRVTRNKICRNIVIYNGYAGGCTNSSDPDLDPGTGNEDGNRHTINGYSNNTTC
jgi:hypothetical protein